MRIIWVAGLGFLITIGQALEARAMEVKAGEQEVVSCSPRLSSHEALKKARSSGFQVTMVNCGLDPVAVVSTPSRQSKDGVENDLAESLHRVLVLDASPGSRYLVTQLLSRAEQDQPIDDEEAEHLSLLAEDIAKVRELDEKGLKVDPDSKLDEGAKATGIKEARDSLRNSLLHEYRELWKKLYITDNRLELTFIGDSTAKIRKASKHGIAGRAKTKISLEQDQQTEKVRANTCALNAFGATLFGAGSEPIVVIVPQKLHAKVVEDLQVMWQLGIVQEKETTGPRLYLDTFSDRWRSLYMVRHVVLNLPSVLREIVAALRGPGDALPALEVVAEAAATLPKPITQQELQILQNEISDSEREHKRILVKPVSMAKGRKKAGSWMQQ